MALTSISTLIELGSAKWSKIDLNNLNSFYIIGIKETKGATDTIDPKSIKIVNFEVGIESGIQNTYLTIGHLTLNFSEITSKDSAVNSITAMSRYLNYPSTFYIRPTDVVTYDGEVISKGTSKIGININAVKLN